MKSFCVSASGTASNPITITGVPGPNGEPAVIDGENATQSPSIAYHATPILYRFGVVQVGPSRGTRSGILPSYITIENLTIQNGYRDNSFTAYNGQQVHYDNFCAGLYVEGAKHLIIRNCILKDNGLGLFINSKNGSTGISEDIMVDGNSIYNNGVSGDYHEHNIYTEAIGITFQNNYIGDVRQGSGGCALKDRSAGTVIRYNWIGAGGHSIDLVETQGGEGAIDKDPSYKATYVYGNVIFNAGPHAAAFIVHYGGDQWSYRTYRRGTLYFYDNTVVNIGNQTGPRSRWYTCMFKLPDNVEASGQAVQETVDCRNNIFYTASEMPGAQSTDLELLSSDGTASINLGANWVSRQFQAFHQPYNVKFIGTITGRENLIVGKVGTNDPGFVNFEKGDLHLTATSQCIDRGGPMPAAVPQDYAVVREYVDRESSEPRSRAGAADLGAFSSRK